MQMCLVVCIECELLPPNRFLLLIANVVNVNLLYLERGFCWMPEVFSPSRRSKLGFFSSRSSICLVGTGGFKRSIFAKRVFVRPENPQALDAAQCFLQLIQKLMWGMKGDIFSIFKEL